MIPKDLRQEIIRQCHDEPTSRHLGIFKTFNRILDRAYWPGLKADVAKYIRNCHKCRKFKTLQQAPIGCIGGHSLVSRPWQVVSADIVGPLPKTSHGHQFIFVVSDCFSKFALFFPMRKATATAIVKHLEDSVFLQFGVPEVLITDNGVQLRSLFDEAILYSLLLATS